MSAIYKKEMYSYFTSGIAYVVLSVFTFFAGVFFMMVCLTGDTANMTSLFTNMFMVVLLLLPILTMRLFSDEKKQKTDQGLLTAPVNLFQVVMGKYLAALTVYAISLVIFIVFAIVIACFTQPSWMLIISNLIGVFLMGAAMIAICCFISSLTESQVVSAVVGITVGLFISFMDSLASSVSNDFLSGAINSISFLTRYQNFAVGIINLASVLFFVSVCVIFLFLTIRVYEKKRWS